MRLNKTCFSVLALNSLFSSVSSLADLVWRFSFTVLVEPKYLVILHCLLSSLCLCCVCESLFVYSWVLIRIQELTLDDCRGGAEYITGTSMQVVYLLGKVFSSFLQSSLTPCGASVLPCLECSDSVLQLGVKYCAPGYFDRLWRDGSQVAQYPKWISEITK